MTRHSKLLALPLILTLAACGGGGSDIASAPPPPVAIAPTPVPLHLTSITVEKIAPLSARAGLTGGTYETKAIYTDPASDNLQQQLSPSQILAPGTLRLGIDADHLKYTVTASIAGFPAQESFDFSAPIVFGAPNPIDRSGFGHHVLRTERYSDGSTRTSEQDIETAAYSSPRTPLSGGGYVSRDLYLDISHRYLTLGNWAEFSYVPDAASPSSFRNVSAKYVRFAQGLRTEVADIPASGTATYSDQFVPFSLTADFGARTIGAKIDYEYFEGEYGISDGLSARGSSAITGTGDFLIAMDGSFIGGAGSPTAEFTGTIDGALFGPQAAEAGGVYQFFRNGVEYQAGAFAATKGP
jgi:hypothetical protein